MSKNTIVVLSDIHIGDNSPTVWYQKTIHEGFLMAVLDDVIKNKTTVLELILLGDVVDFWTYPADDIPPTFDEIIAANPNIFGPNGKLSQVLTALEGKVTYVRGNHDMNITQADLDKIQNPNGHKIKLVGDVYFPLGPNNRRILCTHGHLDTMFNAPYNEPNNPIAPMPIGHFVTRAISTSMKRKLRPGQSVANLPESGNPGFGDFIPGLVPLLLKAQQGNKDAIEDLSSVAKLMLGVISSTLGVSDNQPIKLPGGKTFTVGQAKTVYNNLFTEWVNKRSFLTAIKAVAADANGTYLGWFAQQRGFQQGADLVVMGHTHFVKSGLLNGDDGANSLINYVNAGFNCPAVPDIGKDHPTFVKINVDQATAGVFQIVKSGNLFNITPAPAPKDNVVYSTISEDFSCYVVIDNRGSQAELHRQSYKAEYGHYVVAPPAIIKPGEVVRIWLQDYPFNVSKSLFGFDGLHGAEGSATYVKQDNKNVITFKYGCPFISDNYASAEGITIQSKSGKNNWSNSIQEGGHPFYVRFSDILTSTYVITVYTGDKMWAGTDANIYITLMGSQGNSPERKLDTLLENEFERGDVDSFTYTTRSVGDLSKIKIRHDNTGAGSGWFLNKVIVKEPGTGKQWTFPCNRWLATDEDDGKIERILNKA